MRFKVELSELAEEQYDNILGYLAYKLKNSQAVAGVMDDFDLAIADLQKIADSFGFCKSDCLRAMGLHKYHFRNHRYLFVYRIISDRVIVEGLYHELQDYENVIE